MATCQLLQSHIATGCTRGSQNTGNIKSNWEMQKTRHSLQPLLQIYVSIKPKTDKCEPPSTQPDSRCQYEMVERVVEQQQALCAALLELCTGDLMPSDQEFTAMD